MKRIFTLALLALFVVGQMATAQTIWDGTTDTEWLGTGTEADPYQICSPQELAGLAELVNSGTKDFAGEYICLTADIYLNAETTPDSLKLEWPRIGGIAREQAGENFAFDSTAFCGTFDGRNHTIHGIHYGQMPADSTGWDDPFVDFVVDFTGWERGFFGLLTNATIENLNIHQMTLAGAYQMGGLSPYANHTTIRNVHITGSSVRSSLGDYGGGAAGLVGQLNSCLVENCTIDAYVQGTRGVGVLASSADSTTVIRNCSTSGFAYMSQYTCGGLVGYNRGLIERCSSSADVSRGYYKYAQSSGAPDCAGFVGDNTGVIRDCYATGNVVQAQLEGHGFCGRNTGRLENCYATGNVEGHVSCNVSTFLGVNGIMGTYGDPDVHGTVINCFGTGTCTFINPDNEYVVYGGVIGSSWCAGVSHITNCYFDSDKNPLAQTKVYGEFDVTTTYLQSKEFVDTLNMMSALLGLTKWQYNPGSYPTLTNEKATNITDYFAGGSGTAADPWRIETKEHLKNFAKYVNHGYHFAGDTLLQTADIVLNPPFEKWGEEMPELWIPIGKTVIGHNVAQQEVSYTYFFNGMYDGGLHEIQNLYCYSLTDKQGLFGKLYHNARIRNLGVTDAYVIGTGNSGILAAEVDRHAVNVDIRQCWTSGYVEDKSWGAAGILGQIATEGSVCSTNILNCYTSATIKGATYTKPVVGDQNYVGGESSSNDTVGNFLFYGTASEVYHASGGREKNRNYFFNLDSVVGATNSVANYEAGGRSTAYLQSKEFVNELNAWVSSWNETHTADPLLYWQYRENDYPFYTTIVPEYFTVTFVTNGSAAITSQYILPGSKIVVPVTPTKENEIFAGWFTDAAFTQCFDPEQLINADLTLYAKWLPADYAEDYSFINPFATSFVIKNKEQLAALRNIVNGVSTQYTRDVLDGKTIKLGNDIVLNDTTNWQQWGKTAAATPWWPIGAHYYATFDCTFDGQGYKIIGLYSNQNAEWSSGFSSSHSDGYIGLFGYVGEKASIQNVGIEAAYCEGDVYVGALAGYSKAPILNCHARARVANVPEADNSGRGYSGILIGETTASVTDCYAIGEVTGISYIGGLIGKASQEWADTIRHCYAIADVKGCNNVGGLIGASNKCVIEECYAEGDVVLYDDYATRYYPCEKAGGLVGSTSAAIINCYATGSITAEGSYVGGITGRGYEVHNSYFAGTMQGGNNVDGIAWETTTANTYYDAELAPLTTGQTTNGRTTAQLKKYETYQTWDFATIWGKRESYNNGYPYLQHLLPEALGGVLDALLLSETNVDLAIGETKTLTVSTSPAIVLPEVYWSSADTNIVKVSDGVLTPIECGNTYVVVHTSDTAYTDTCWVNVFYHPTGVAISEQEIYMLRNSTYQLAATVFPAGARQEVKWSHNNAYSYSYITVDENGLVQTGESTGTFQIYATTLDWKYRDTCVVHIVENLPVQSITLSHQRLTLAKGETITITATVLPESTTLSSSDWWSTDQWYVAYVEANGNTATITARGGGTANIIVSKDGVSDTCVVTVTDPNKVSSVMLDTHEVILEVGQKYQLNAMVLPETASNKNVTWDTESAWIALISNGEITGRNVGTTKVWVKTWDGGFTDTCYVTVVQPSTTLELSFTDVAMKVGEEMRINATITVGNTDQSITWTSSNNDVATVEAKDWYGVEATIKAINQGSATLTATTADGISATCEVMVTESYVAVTGITLSETALTLKIGDTYQLIATITPADATNQTVNWMSSNPDVIGVQEGGWLTALSEGNVVIIATTEDGGKTAMCTLTVTKGIDTALENVEAATSVQKILDNGVIYILRNGERYMIDGQKVE